MRALVYDVFMFAGAGLVTAGASMLGGLPVGLIAAGALMIVLTWAGSR